MKTKVLIICLMAVCGFAAEKKEDKKKEHRMHAVTEGNTKSIMMIEPEARARDYILAFDKLRGEIPPTKIYFQLEKQAPINNIMSVELMQNGTLMLFRLSTPKGASFKIVPIEDVIEITHEL